MGLIAGAVAQSGSASLAVADAAAKTEREPLGLSEYEPKSMLHVRESHVERARFAVIHFHTHISFSAKSAKGVELTPERKYLGTPQELLAVMDRKNIRAMVNLTGGYEQGLADAVGRYDLAFPGRFYTFTEPSYSRSKEPDYPKFQSGNRAGTSQWRPRSEDSQDSGPLSPREHYIGHISKDR
jgi:hypothetical protein